MTALDRHRVTIDEVDAAGVVFAPTVVAFAHRAYERLALARGLDLARVVRERALALPLVRVEADFRAPIRHGDEVAAACACTRVGETSYAVRIALAVGGAEAAVVTQTHACVDPKAGKAVAVPDWLRAVLADWR